jgi:mannosyltransferase OCH1-like enzyme
MSNIPKTIHYCWFGRGKKNYLLNKCIKTFSDIHPEWEIKEWNEDNTPMNPYITRGLQEKTWASVADFVRLYAIHEEGGVYLDTDVEVVKPFDSLLSDNLFFGFECREWICNATLGGTKGNNFIKLCIDTFLKKFEETPPSLASISGPVFLTNMLKEHYGLAYHCSPTAYPDGIRAYPEKFFYPYYYTEKFTPECITDDTISIHHWAKSW